MKYLKLFEYFDDHDTTSAKFEIMDSDTQMVFYFNKEDITDPEHIKDLIEKYNHFYLEEGSCGGPPPKGFVDYFNQKYSKTKSATQKIFYPTIDLIIQTRDYGKLIIGFSIRDKSFKLYNWGLLKSKDSTKYDNDILKQIDKFVKNKLNKMTIDEVISYLNLNIKNKIDWNWIE